MMVRGRSNPNALPIMTKPEVVVLCCTRPFQVLATFSLTVALWLVTRTIFELRHSLEFVGYLTKVARRVVKNSDLPQDACVKAK
jgi:hypothetical protein